VVRLCVTQLVEVSAALADRATWNQSYEQQQQQTQKNFVEPCSWKKLSSPVSLDALAIIG
jgi:hypothetical protein